MLRKVLIANRGEVALRIIRACRELGIRTVAVFSSSDRHALHARFADEAVCIGPPNPKNSYLCMPSIIAAAEITGADAVHPGYGFLSENADFAEAVQQCGLVFIGPSPEVMRVWGDKVSARARARECGLPLLPGSEALRDVEHARGQSTAIGFPVIIKASGGGGGRGMKVVRTINDFDEAFATARAEAISGFGNPTLFVERYVERPRHIEFQVIADQYGNAMCIGDRECSVQRRHQKLLEEAPAPGLNHDQREAIAATIIRAMRETHYNSLGTLEFILDEDGSLYFLEMNTRLQVEHTVTEMVTGIDLVAEQILLATGKRLPAHLSKVAPRGHAIECRINAEDPVTFAPSPGRITEYFPPGGAGVRVDSGVYGGWTVPPHYDSLLAKVIVHAATRASAISRMQRALDEFIIEGVRTNLSLQQRILDAPAFRQAVATTHLVASLSEPETARRVGSS